MTLAVFLAVTAVFARVDGIVWASRLIVVSAGIVALHEQSGWPA